MVYELVIMLIEYDRVKEMAIGKKAILQLKKLTKRNSCIAMNIETIIVTQGGN